MTSPATRDPFPEDSPVLVRYPLPGTEDHDRNTWPWLPGTVLQRCDVDEWHVVIDVLALAMQTRVFLTGLHPRT